MADFMRVKYENPKMKQSERANQIGLSTSTLQRYRNDINMLSPYRINSNSNNERTKKGKNTDFNNDTHHDPDVKMTSNDLKRPQSTSNENNKKTKTKNNLKGGFVQEKIEVNKHYLDKILKKNNT